MIADAEALGFSDEAIDQLRAEHAASTPDEGLAIHPDNVVAVRLLLALATQWRAVALSTMDKARIHRTGLDYGVIETTARMRRLEMDDLDFTRLQILEAETLKAWAEDAKR